MVVPMADAERLLHGTNAAPIYFSVLDAFNSAFADADGVAFARAPGRVNMIGEHTDYNGLPVLPMAVDREIVVAFAASEDCDVELVNAGGRPPRTFTISPDIPHYETGDWGNYAKAAAQALWHWAREHSPDSLPLKGFRGCVGGTIPPGSGLSSSSALVVAIATVLVAVNDLGIAKPDLADLLAKGERYVGTEGGGMDQAVSILSQEGMALKIDFLPLKARPVPLPREHVLVVANSMVSANKTGGARLAYNTRVAECKLGLSMLKHDLSATHPEVTDAALLQAISLSVPEWDGALDALPDGPLSLREAAAYCDSSEDELGVTCLRQQDGSFLSCPEAGFEPTKRCRHVLTEADRVERAAEAMRLGDAGALGQLMNESHASCANDYEISCPELDELVSILRCNGALGARLTGAGFGGCAVALVRSNGVPSLVDGVWKDYYSTYLSKRGMAAPPDRDQVLFACTAVRGAGVLEF